MTKQISIWAAGVALMIAGAPGCKKKDSAAGTRSSEAAVQTTTASPDDAGAPVVPQVRWQAGQRYQFRLQATNEFEMSGPKQPRMLQSTTLGQDYHVTASSGTTEGATELELEYRDTEMTLAMNGASVINVDTRKGGTPGGEAFQRMVGSKLNFRLGSDNLVQSVEGLTNLQKKTFGSMPGPMQESFDGMFSEDYFKQMVELGRDWPTVPVKPGDSWPARTRMALGVVGTVTMDLKYTFRGWDTRESRRCAQFDYSGDIKGTDGKAFGPMATSMKVTDGKISGKAWYDPELKMVTDDERDQRMTMVIALGKNPTKTTNFIAMNTMTNLVRNRTHTRLAQMAPAAAK